MLFIKELNFAIYKHDFGFFGLNFRLNYLQLFIILLAKLQCIRICICICICIFKSQILNLLLGTVILIIYSTFLINT